MENGSKPLNQDKNVMLYMHTLKANKPEYKGATLSMPKSTQTLMDRPKTCQDKHKIFTNVSLKHSRNKGSQPKTCLGITRLFMETMLSMHGVPRPI